MSLLYGSMFRRYYKSWRNQHKNCSRNSQPTTKGLYSFEGNQEHMNLPAPQNVLKVAEEFQVRYGTRMPLVCGPLQVLWLTHPDDVGKILSSKEKTTDKVWLYPLIFSEWLGTCLFNTTGQEYFTRRRKLMPAFNFGILENFNCIFNRNSEALVDILKTKEAQGEAADIHTLANLCALDIIFESATGTRINSLAKQDHEFQTAHVKEFKYLYERASSPWLWPKFLWTLSPLGKRERANRDILNNFIDKIIQEHKAEMASQDATSEISEIDGNENKLEESSSTTTKRKRYQFFLLPCIL
ncbi:unnamed protein product [Allacma fusca]|uniref:Cytochrome P450 n=1 Tax=Allacma fusca TaxID=39272 RepID=A0A8J2K4D8_9HEXA|nr:unnamed protein product [Allacma fusca]